VTQRKPDRHPRRGTETRKRSRSVNVRLTDAEHAVLSAASERTGKGAATLLREAFLAAEQAEGSPGV
jgi:hypothetical protein